MSTYDYCSTSITLRSALLMREQATRKNFIQADSPCTCPLPLSHASCKLGSQTLDFMHIHHSLAGVHPPY